MPPFLPRKRSTPPITSRPNSAKRARLVDALDAEATNNVPSLKNTKTFSLGSDDSSSDSQLSDIDSDQFEDVPVRMNNTRKPNEVNESDDEDEDEDEDVEWEDAATAETSTTTTHVPMANGPIQITLRNDDEDVIDYGTAAKATSGKKGPSKREKQARIMTHQLHVQFLLLHNAIRNSWIEDKQVQDILVKQLPAQIQREVDKWKKASGLIVPEDKKIVGGKGKRQKKAKQVQERNQRDWGQPSQRLEVGKADMSHGDPLITLLRILSLYWKKRFAITAPGLRKRGYGTKHSLKQDIISLRNDPHDPERHGEKIEDLAAFRKIAEKGEGSRDVGAQLFTALLRGLGIQARLVASLQPSGYGWTKVEQMISRKPVQIQIEDISEDDSEDDILPVKTTKSKINPGSVKSKPGKRPLPSKKKSKVISLDTDEEDDDEENKSVTSIKDDDSIVDVTPTMPKQRRAKYDRDLVFPIYWTEAVSPITNKVFPVSSLVLETPVAASPEALLAFEPKGAKAEKGRQVLAYVVAYSADGTAKDVTVRYLRKQIWPGKTKGFRIPVEKIPVYDNRGKIKRHIDFDWFKFILGPYTRSDAKRTAVDDVEDSTDLIPQQPEKKADEDGVDTLQSLKSSADFVLERFLRREEALIPGAKPVRTFISGKGDKYKEEQVYRRSDVERCLTAESWHKEGRRPKLGETPMKMVPVRAVTLTRKREAEEHERQYGEKQTQGLYSRDQTEYIIPPPIQDGIIPKNAYGNMDCFAPTMVPRGAVHIPLRGTVRICKKLDIDFAEAVTGFEFGNKRAVPVCTGVVVAEENERLVKDAWYEWNEEQKRKEETKMEKLTLDLWRKFVLGLRIRERVQDMYGEEIGVIQDVPTGFTKEDAIAIEEEDESMGGGFMNEDENEEMGGGFLLPHEDEAAPAEDLIMDDLKLSQMSNKPEVEYPTPASISPKGNAKKRKSLEATSTEMVKAEQSEATDDTSDQDEMDAKDTSSDEELDEDDSDINGTITNFKSEISDDGNEDESSENDSEEAEELYTPRSTRTRNSKPKYTPQATFKPQGHQKKPTFKAETKPAGKPTSVLKVRSRSTTNSKRKHPLRDTDNDNDDDDDDDEKEEIDEAKHSAPKSAQQGRGRGRPRKSNNRAITEVSKTPVSVRGRGRGRPKRSTTLLRKESTVVTSPYFEDE